MLNVHFHNSLIMSINLMCSRRNMLKLFTKCFVIQNRFTTKARQSIRYYHKQRNIRFQLVRNNCYKVKVISCHYVSSLKYMAYQNMTCVFSSLGHSERFHTIPFHSNSSPIIFHSQLENSIIYKRHQILHKEHGALSSVRPFAADSFHLLLGGTGSQQ
jgi:hypothetical protein